MSSQLFPIHSHQLCKQTMTNAKSIRNETHISRQINNLLSSHIFVTFNSHSIGWLGCKMTASNSRHDARRAPVMQCNMQFENYCRSLSLSLSLALWLVKRKWCVMQLNYTTKSMTNSTTASRSTTWTFNFGKHRKHELAWARRERESDRVFVSARGLEMCPLPNGIMNEYK